METMMSKATADPKFDEAQDSSGMRAESVPMESIPSEKGFTISVKTLTGKPVTIPNIYGSDTINTLRERIQEKEGIPPDQQRLIYAEQELRIGKSSLPVYRWNSQVEIILIRLAPGRSTLADYQILKVCSTVD